jgi:hypothetical protein
MTQLKEFLNEKESYDFRNSAVKERIRQINQETDGIERQEASRFTGLLYGNGEESENDTLESSL